MSNTNDNRPRVGLLPRYPGAMSEGPEIDESTAAALMFNVEGTLVDTLPLMYSVFQQLLLEFGGGILHWSRFLELMRANMQGPQLLVTLAAEQGLILDPTSVALPLGKAMLTITKCPAPQKLNPIEPTVRIARLAKERGQPIAVVAVGPREWLKWTLENAGLRSLFLDCVMVASDTPGLKRQKPHPDPYLLAAVHLGVDPAQCIGYEDSDIGLLGFRNAGIRAVDVRWLPGYQLQPHPSIVIPIPTQNFTAVSQQTCEGSSPITEASQSSCLELPVSLPAPARRTQVSDPGSFHVQVPLEETPQLSDSLWEDAKLSETVQEYREVLEAMRKHAAALDMFNERSAKLEQELQNAEMARMAAEGKADQLENMVADMAQQTADLSSEASMLKRERDELQGALAASERDPEFWRKKNNTGIVDHERTPALQAVDAEEEEQPPKIKATTAELKQLLASMEKRTAELSFAGAHFKQERTMLWAELGKMRRAVQDLRPSLSATESEGLAKFMADFDLVHAGCCTEDVTVQQAEALGAVLAVQPITASVDAPVFAATADATEEPARVQNSSTTPSYTSAETVAATGQTSYLGGTPSLPISPCEVGVLSETSPLRPLRLSLSAGQGHLESHVPALPSEASPVSPALASAERATSALPTLPDLPVEGALSQARSPVMTSSHLGPLSPRSVTRIAMEHSPSWLTAALLSASLSALPAAPLVVPVQPARTSASAVTRRLSAPISTQSGAAPSYTWSHDELKTASDSTGGLRGISLHQSPATDSSNCVGESALRGKQDGACEGSMPKLHAARVRHVSAGPRTVAGSSSALCSYGLQRHAPRTLSRDALSRSSSHAVVLPHRRVIPSPIRVTKSPRQLTASWPPRDLPS